MTLHVDRLSTDLPRMVSQCVAVVAAPVARGMADAPGTGCARVRPHLGAVPRFVSARALLALQLWAAVVLCSGGLMAAPAVLGATSSANVQDPCIDCPPDGGPAYAVAVTPDGDVTPTRPVNTTGWSAPFQITNTGSNAAVYTLSCVGSGGVTCTGLSVGSVGLGGGGGTATVDAYYSVGGVGTGTLTLLADGPASDSGSYSVPIAVFSVAVTPDGGTAVNRAANSSGYAEAFTVTNTGGGADTYTFSCSSTANISCTAPASVSLAAAASAQVTVSYSTGVVGIGTLQLKATSPYASDQGSLEIPVVPHTLALTPDSQAVGSLASASNVQRFSVAYAGAATATFNFQVLCSGTATACSTPGSLSLAGGATATVSVSYTSGSAGATGRVRLLATHNTNGAIKDSGWVNITAGTIQTSTVNLASVNAESVVERGLCLTIAAGDGVASECGDLRAVHALPTTRTVGRARTPTLIYSSQHAQPYPVVAALVTLPAGAANPDSVTAKLFISGVRGRGRWDGGAWSPGRASRVVLADTTNALATGIFADTLEVTSWYGATPRVATATGEVVVVNRSASPFGVGWWLAGLEQLLPASMTWIGGDGSVRRYMATGISNTWAAPKIDHPDTLKYDPVALRYTRYLLHGVQVVLDAQGRHVATINRLGYRTVFNYDACGRLSTIKLPPDTVSKVYQFTYAASCGRLQSVTAPPAGATARVTTITMDAGRIVSIRDPDNTTVTFRYASTPADVNQIISRTDRRGSTVSYGYDPAKRLARVSVTAVFGQFSIVTRLRSLESVGLGNGAASPAVDTARAYAYLDAPRTDVADTTIFWLDRYGAPQRIRDALSSETAITRDGTWPALVARARYPNGRILGATYDARGNMVSSTDSSTSEIRFLGDVGTLVYATTRYAWDPIWDFVTRMVPPEKDSVVMQYDPANGNRQWQQDARGAASRVTFGYNAQKLLAAIQRPLAPRADSVYYNSLGNDSVTVTALGFRSFFFKDGLGRDTLIVTPIDSLQQQRDSLRSVYNLADRVTETKAFGPAITYDTWELGAVYSLTTPAEAATVRNTFDAEGNLLRVERTGSPNPTGLSAQVNQFRYDLLGRLVAEVATDGLVDSTEYDPSGNAIRRIPRRGAAYTITITYDAVNRPIRRIVPEVTYASYTPPGMGSGNWQFPLYSNNQSGGWTIAADTTAFVYDALGNVVRANNGAARITRTYNLDGSLSADTIRVLPYVGADTNRHVYGLRYTYDLNGRRKTLEHPFALAPVVGGQVRTQVAYAYNDTTGSLRSVTDVLGNVFSYTFDLEGRLSRLTMPGGVSEDLFYDAGGQLRRQVLGRTDTTVFADTLFYDGRGKVIRALTAQDTSRNDYTALGMVARTFNRDRTWTTGWQAEQYYLDALGNQSASARRVVEDTYFVPSTDSSSNTYNVTSGRLELSTGWEQVMGGEEQQSDPVYDPSGNKSFLYRGVWGWKSILFPPTADAQLQERTAYYYAADDRLRVVDRRTCVYERVGTGTFQCHTEDEPGLANRGAFEEFRYDALGRRILARTRSEMSCSLNCDRSIRRFVWDGDQLLYEIRYPGQTGIPNDSLEVDTGFVAGPDPDYAPYGRVVYTHGLGIDQPLGLIRINYYAASTQPFLVVPHANWRGVDRTGSLSNGSFLPPCGTGATASCVDPGWPAGKEGVYSAPLQRDKFGPLSWLGGLILGQRDASGQLYRRNRYYDPASGRFTQEDPIGLAGGLNLYGFAGADPVNFSDPFGDSVQAGCRNVHGTGGVFGSHCAIRVGEGGKARVIELNRIPGTDSVRILTYAATDERAAGFEWQDVATPKGQTVQQFEANVERAARHLGPAYEAEPYSAHSRRNSNFFVYSVIRGGGGQIPRRAIGRGGLFNSPGLCGGQGWIFGGRYAVGRDCSGN